MCSTSSRILIPGEREKILEVVSENLSSFVFNQEGVDLVCNSLDLMDVKQKKQLLKGLKGKIKELLLAENSLFHLVLIKILSSVDDTTVVKKTILNVRSLFLDLVLLRTRKSPRILKS